MIHNFKIEVMLRACLLLSGVSITFGLEPDLHEFLPGPASSAPDFTINVWTTSLATDSICMQKKILLMQSITLVHHYLLIPKYTSTWINELTH